LLQGAYRHNDSDPDYLIVQKHRFYSKDIRPRENGETGYRSSGCTMQMPPASGTAATSSGLEQGYIAPQISDTPFA
jgi:hypothetical protein